MGAVAETLAGVTDPGSSVLVISRGDDALLAIDARQGAHFPQAPDGQWEEPQFTGTGFPRDFMLKYHLYRNYWPLWALGRYRRIVSGTPVHMPASDPHA